jgi:hypothetical protein
VLTNASNHIAEELALLVVLEYEILSNYAYLESRVRFQTTPLKFVIYTIAYSMLLGVMFV